MNKGGTDYVQSNSSIKSKRWNKFTSETADNFDEIAEDLNIDF